jgi:hypothetical protein
MPGIMIDTSEGSEQSLCPWELLQHLDELTGLTHFHVSTYLPITRSSSPHSSPYTTKGGPMMGHARDQSHDCQSDILAWHCGRAAKGVCALLHRVHPIALSAMQSQCRIA